MSRGGGDAVPHSAGLGHRGGDRVQDQRDQRAEVSQVQVLGLGTC